MVNVSYTPMTPLNFLRRSSFVYPEKTAVLHGEQRITYKEFNQRANRLASALKGAGINEGDRVAFLAPNIPPLLDAHYGVPLAGAVLVAINIRLSSREVAYILNHSGAKILFVDTAFSHVIEPIVDELESVKTIVNIRDCSDGEELPGPLYENFLATGSPEDIPVSLEDENQTISINYTSGTTGLPKGVMYSHRGAYLNALGEALESQMNVYTNYLWTLPMFHCNGWCFTWGVTAVGGMHICLRSVVVKEIYTLIEEEGVSHFCAAPTVLITMANDPAAKELRLKRKLHIVTAGAPPSPTVIRNVEDIGAEIIHVYGLTETYGPHSICAWQPEWDTLAINDRARIKSRQGVPYITALEMRVVDSSMNDVPADGQTMGEVVMRGNNVMKGYFNDADATEEAFAGGWFHSGDLAVMNPDGYIEIKDRKKDIIISGGENISTVELEHLLFRHPHVQEVAVVAIPDEKWGEVPKAFVVPKPGTDPTEEEIIQYCRDNIARYKCPKSVEFGDLPKTSTGKIKKYVLREREWQGKEKRVN
ncbi:acyl--CoA ligase family protein [Dethiobacter alkaliphilus]|uniref:AMP-dependent synthetase and ligase n=1 Tax=Dethiobacter alkaliphilus AHT 1 TaxID=555088 RepID=C0GH76_DETAL|nr:acyl--CoA ligase family protein [Dethiobacter alkaliphilus]EEG77378.1 AMP-dependent synthetase and ligase [Dethiobacter alkaliphilus AHT 1]